MCVNPSQLLTFGVNGVVNPVIMLCRKERSFLQSDDFLTAICQQLNR